MGLLLLGSLASQAAIYNDSLIHNCPQGYHIEKAIKNEKPWRPTAGWRLAVPPRSDPGGEGSLFSQRGSTPPVMRPE
jgi:hypothetical protein